MARKASGGWRPVIDLKQLNHHIDAPHFRMHNISSVLSTVEKKETTRVTSQFLCGVLDVTLVPYFSLASLCSVMLLSDNRNIMDYWMLVEGTVLNMFSCKFNVVEYNSIGIL